ncbi:MAG: RMD1 family protein [Candidatus Aenigmatarchaeota archaeon]
MVESIRFSGYYIANEIDIKKYYLDKHNKIWKKTWEEPLIVEKNRSKALIFAFGSIVFENETDEFKEEIFKEFKKYFIQPTEKTYTSNFFLKVFDSSRDIKQYCGKEIKNRKIFTTEEEGLTLKKYFNQDFEKVVALVVAQDSSLRYIEEKTEEMLETVNGLINRMKFFNFNLRKIINYLIDVSKIRSAIISDLMLIEKPEIAWEISYLSEIYYSVRDYFEIKIRVDIVLTKINLAKELGEMVERLISERRLEFLEVLIVLLFIIDIILYML